MTLPVEINPLLLTQSGSYTVGRSLRFRSSASAYLNRTPAAAGNQQKWTWSGWVKRGAFGSYQTLFGQGTGSTASGYGFIRFDNNDVFTASSSPNGASSSIVWTSTPVYRDPSGWYHVVAVLDTTLATAADRFILYINGVRQTGSFSTTPAQNANIEINRASAHQIGASNASAVGNFHDGYLAEVNFIDGQALTPSSFGANDVNGVWQPKKYTGTYGTNGFYLNFSDNSAATAAAIGKDSSGNGNNWTPNNISLTAGTTYDSMVDSPTVGATASNYAVLNPLDKNSNVTVSNGNLTASISTTGWLSTRATIGMSSGKWYWEATTSNTNLFVGIGTAATALSSFPGSTSDSYGYQGSNGNKYNNNAGAAYGSAFSANDIIGVAFDATTGTLTYYKNGVSMGTAFSSIPANTYFPMFGCDTNGSVQANFGQRPFSYTPPTGYSALNTYNLPAPSIPNGAQYMAATTYTGTGSNITITNSVNGIGFQPDFVWTKGRSAATNNILIDAVRGGANYLISDSTSAEANNAAAGIQSFNSTGYVMGTGGAVNTNGATYVGWQWKGGGTGVTNTSGTITSTVSANTTAGFSVVTYTGTGANATVGHGLGVAPSMIIVKSRTSAYDWFVYHSSLTSAAYYLRFSTTAAQASDTTVWNNTAPSSSVFSLGTTVNVNAIANNFVAYCFAAVRGYSAFGSYNGTGSSDGAFVYTGFRPRWIMIKRTDTLGYWAIKDSSRNGYNQTDPLLYANVADAEYSAAQAIDILSNGFKLRSTGQDTNGSGGTYIYAAFAENPFNYSRAR